MDKIDSLDKINALVSDIRSLRKGYLTNFFLDRKKHSIWIEKGELFYISFPDCHFLLHLTDSVNNLFFLTTTTQQLAEGLKTFLPIFAEQVVVDIVGDAKIASLKDVFVEQGFSVYQQLYRMSRLGVLEYKEISAPNVCFAEEADASVVLDMLHANFNPLSEQLPCYEEIQDFISRKGVLVYKDKGKIYGFIIFELNGLTLYLRYWFVLLEYRDLKIGSNLFNEFMRAGHATKRQLFWVIADNENAIKRYRHYGFEVEQLYDYVLIRNKQSYIIT